MFTIICKCGWNIQKYVQLFGRYANQKHQNNYPQPKTDTEKSYVNEGTEGRGRCSPDPGTKLGRSEEHTLVSIEQEARGYRFVLAALDDIISYPSIHRWRSWFTHGGTRQEVQGSMPGESLGNFQVSQPFCPHSAALGHTRPQTQTSTKKTSLGVKCGGRIQRTTLPSW